MLWQLGMPVLTSATPAYERAMAAAGFDMTCSSPADWRARLAEFVEADSAALQKIGERACRYAREAYSQAEFVERFDAALSAAGVDVA